MSTGSYKVDFSEVKRSVHMEQIIQFLGLAGLKQRGPSQWKGACPFCRGLNCFVVSNDGGRDKTGAFNCFKCPAGGDQIELVSLVRGHPRRDGQGSLAAAKELHARFIAKGEDGVGRANRENTSNASPQPRRERQGFDPEAYAKTLDPAHEALASLGLDAETLREWKAGYASSGVNRGRLALPVASRDGAILGFMGKGLGDVSPNLIFPNGLPPHEHIFGADRVAAGQLYLVRDPIDVLKACQSGCGNVVSFLTEEISGIQLESLAALMDERKCETLSFF